MRRLLPLAALVLTAAACGGSKPAATTTTSQFAGAEMASPKTSPDFALRDQDGRLVRLSALRGKVVLLTFLYTHCPDTCPLIATHLSGALERLPALAPRVRILAITVDPKRDTAAAARAFVRRHRLVPEFHYLLGTRHELAPVWRSYDVVVQHDPEATVSHSAYILAVDPQGRQRIFYDATAKPAAVAHDVRLLLSK